MTLLEFRRDKPKPGQIYWYCGAYNKQGCAIVGLSTHPVEIMSWPMRDSDPIRIFVRHTPGNPCTAGWVTLENLGAEIITPEIPKG